MKPVGAGATVGSVRDIVVQPSSGVWMSTPGSKSTSPADQTPSSER
jgi:hypothetical protein